MAFSSASYCLPMNSGDSRVSNRSYRNPAASPPAITRFQLIFPISSSCEDGSPACRAIVSRLLGAEHELVALRIQQDGERAPLLFLWRMLELHPASHQFRVRLLHVVAVERD